MFCLPKTAWPPTFEIIAIAMEMNSIQRPALAAIRDVLQTG